MSDSRYIEYLTIKEDFWKVPYIGRRVNESYYSIFDHNGYYPSDDRDNHPEYSDNDIVINLKLEVKDEVINYISYYKVKDHGIYYRGSDERALTLHDKRVFCEVLDSCTTSVAPQVLNTLINNPIQEGWSIKKANKKSITLSHANNTFSVPKDYIETIIDISRMYPDVKDNADFWKINEKNLKLKYMDAVFALLYNFSTDIFPDISFAETASERIHREDQEKQDNDALIAAINKKQTEKALEITYHMINVSSEAINAAIKKNNSKILSAFVPKTKNQSDLISIGDYAIDTDNLSLIDQVNEKGGNKAIHSLGYYAYNKHKINILLLLLDEGFELHMRPENKTELDPKDLMLLVGYHEVVFSIKALEKLYEHYGADPIKTALEHYHNDWNPALCERVNGYDYGETTALVEWLIQKCDYDLMDIAAEHNVKLSSTLYGKEEKVFLKAFLDGGEIWKHTEALFNNSKQFARLMYYRAISDNNVDLLKQLIEYSGLGTSENNIAKALNNYRTNDEMLLVLIDNLDISIDDYPAGEEPLWKKTLRIQGLDTFKAFYSKYREKMMREDTHTGKAISDELRKEMLYRINNPEKARILVELGCAPESLIKETELSTKIHPGMALAELEKVLFGNVKYRDRDKRVYPHKVILNFYNDHTWEVIGRPSRNQWDTPHLDNLHCLVSVNKDNEYDIKMV